MSSGYRNKHSLRRGSLNRSAIISSNFSRRSLASSGPPSEAMAMMVMDSTKLVNRLQEEGDEDDEDSGDSPENKSLYYTAIASSEDEEEIPPFRAPLKDILFSGKKKMPFNQKKIGASPLTLASDSSEDEGEDPFRSSSSNTPFRKPNHRGRRSSFLGGHEVVLLTSESDDQEDEAPGPLTPRSPVRKVEDWLLSTSPIPSSPATPARVILSASSSSREASSEEEGEGVSEFIKDLSEDSEATSKAFGSSSLGSIFGNMFLGGDTTSKGGNLTLMETIREEDNEDIDVEIIDIKAKRLSSVGIQVDMTSSSGSTSSSGHNDASEINNKRVVSVSIQADLSSDSSDNSDHDLNANEEETDNSILVHRVPKKRPPILLSDDDEKESPKGISPSISSEEDAGDSDDIFRDYISSIKKKYSVSKPSSSSAPPAKSPVKLSFSSDEEDKENSSGVRNGTSAAQSKEPEVIDLSSDEEEAPPSKRKEEPPPAKKKEEPASLCLLVNEDKSYASFLSSLSPDMSNGHRRHPEALKFVKRFETHKTELTGLLYKLFNQEAFNGELPSDMEIEWNPRLRKTAGICTQRQKVIGSKTLARSSKIGLSTKVLDSGDRLRDTLIHEMCHAAAWILSGYRDGHGPVWKSWAAKAMNRFPELPIIDRCHNYQIRTKYTYKCEKCGYSIGRHSKSLDTEKKCCGYCRGRFILLRNNKNGSSSSSEPPTPRTPNVFANFVKENYKDIKKPGVSHKDVMNTLSTLFRAAKL